MSISQFEYNNEFINSFLKSVDFTQQDVINGARLDTLQVHHLFHIHNEIAFPKNKEFSKSCAPCRLRVYKKVMIWYNDQLFKEFNPKYLN